MCRPTKNFGKSREFLEDGIGGWSPHERDRVLVVSLDEAIDAGGQFFNALERATLDGPLANNAKPALHLVEPGRIGWCEMDMKRGRRASQARTLGCL